MIRFQKYVLPSLVMLLLTGGCASSRQPGSGRASVDNVAARVSAVKDSLIAAGVDSILIIRKNCRHCEAGIIRPNVKVAQKNKEYLPPDFPKPAYIFWVSDGKYFTRKIDLYGEYGTIMREAFRQLPLYDYFFQNRALIIHEKLLSEIADTILVPEEYGPADTLIKKTFFYYHKPDDNIYNPLVTYTTDLFFYGKGTSFETAIDDDVYNPIVTTPDLAQSFRRKNPESTVLVGNDLEHYTLNRSMKIYIWLKLAESELFDIEMRQLWGPAKKF